MSKSRIGVGFVSAILLMASSIVVQADVIRQQDSEFILFEAEEI